MKNFALIISIFFVHFLHPQEVKRLYEGSAPGLESWSWKEAVFEFMPGDSMIYIVTEPEITHCIAADYIRIQTAILITPRGAVHDISVDNEGIKVAPFYLYKPAVLVDSNPTELPIYESGGHGFGIAPRGTTSDQWLSDFINWLKRPRWL